MELPPCGTKPAASRRWFCLRSILVLRSQDAPSLTCRDRNSTLELPAELFSFPCVEICTQRTYHDYRETTYRCVPHTTIAEDNIVVQRKGVLDGMGRWVRRSMC
ncbi:unnamed protein product [Ectocarpus sp. 12 AP-2014]